MIERKVTLLSASAAALLRALKFFSTTTTGSAAIAAAPVANSPSPRYHGAFKIPLAYGSQSAR